MFDNIINSLKDAWRGLSVSLKAMLLVCAGVVVGLAGLFMYLLRAHTYFIGDDVFQNCVRQPVAIHG
ncbi:MAG: hypothetical protein IJ244_02395 [Bacteroidaceae bacterium]|nr:hypothetical protein [Bacteroidaceae bacterium]